MLTRPLLRVAVLCSRRAPGLLHLLQCGESRIVPWQLVCCLTSEDSFAEQAEVERRGIPLVHHPVRRFYAEHATASLGDLRTRIQYDRRTVQLLEDHRPDVVLLAGYLLLLTRPMLDAFNLRILNVHHSDLLLRDAAGRVRYPGLRAVRDAILAGECETRATVHVVTEWLDEGPWLFRSRPFPVPEVAIWARAFGEQDVLRRVIWAHQEWMLRSAWGPLMEEVLDRLATTGPDELDTNSGRAS